MAMSGSVGREPPIPPAISVRGIDRGTINATSRMYISVRVIRMNRINRAMGIRGEICHPRKLKARDRSNPKSPKP